MSVDDEWLSYLHASKTGNTNNDITPFKSKNEENNNNDTLPKCEELYISTTTKVLFLNQQIDILNIYWDIPIIEYWKPVTGVIKKQMKIVSTTKEEYDIYTDKLKHIPYYNQHIIKRIDNPSARRNKFKDERKITIGLSKRDIMNCRSKVKNAFYNCFALIMRVIHNNEFHEIHVKIFNTGKMEIPGILNEELLQTTKKMIIELLSRILKNNIFYRWVVLKSPKTLIRNS